MRLLIDQISTQQEKIVSLEGAHILLSQSVQVLIESVPMSDSILAVGFDCNDFLYFFESIQELSLCF